MTDQMQATTVQDAVREFNAVSAQHNLGVTYVQIDQAPTDTSGANLSFATAIGAVTFTRATIRRRRTAERCSAAPC